MSARFSYDAATGIVKHWVYKGDASFSSSSTTVSRSEARWENDYNSGQHLFDADAYVVAGTDGANIFQIKRVSAGSQIMIRPLKDGSLTVYGTTTLATNMYDKWFNLKVAHNVGTRELKVWLNDTLKHSRLDQSSSGPEMQYYKNGVYGVWSNKSEAWFRNIRHWTK